MSCIPVLKIPLASKERANPPQQKNVASRLQSRPTLEQKSGPPCYLSIRSEVPRGQDSLKIWKLSNRKNDAQSEVIHTYILKRSHGQYWMNMHLILSCRQSILHATQPKQKKQYIYISFQSSIQKNRWKTNNKQQNYLKQQAKLVTPGCSTSETSARSKSCLFFQAWTSIASQLLGLVVGWVIHQVTNRYICRNPTTWLLNWYLLYSILSKKNVPKCGCFLKILYISIIQSKIWLGTIV